MAAGIPVIEAEQPTRKTRRGRGKSDPMDAHLAVLYAVQLALAIHVGLRLIGAPE